MITIRPSRGGEAERARSGAPTAAFRHVHGVLLSLVIVFLFSSSPYETVITGDAQRDMSHLCVRARYVRHDTRRPIFLGESRRQSEKSFAVRITARTRVRAPECVCTRGLATHCKVDHIIVGQIMLLAFV